MVFLTELDIHVYQRVHKKIREKKRKEKKIISKNILFRNNILKNSHYWGLSAKSPPIDGMSKV